MIPFGLVLWLGFAATFPAPDVVLVYADRVERTTLPEITAAEMLDLEHAWVWSTTAAPVRTEPSQLGVPPAAGLRLQVGVTVPGASLASKDASLWLTAAPAAMWREVPEPLLPRFRLGPSGPLTIPALPGQPWRLRLTSGEHDDARGSWWTDVPAPERPVRLRALAAEDHRFLVLDAEGAPLQSARVSLLDGHPERGGFTKLADLRTGAGGEFLIADLPDAGSLFILVTAPGHVPASVSGRPSSLPGTLRLDRGSALRGRVVDPEGAPLAGVEIQARGWMTEDLQVPLTRTTISGKDGGFHLEALPGRQVELRATAWGRAPLARVVPLPEPLVDLGELTLAEAQTLWVRTVDDRGFTVPRALLRWNAAEAQTAGDGSATLAVAPDQPLRLVIEAEGHLQRRLEIAPPFAPEVEIALVRAFRVSGRLLDAESVPVERGTVQVRTGRAFEMQPLEPGGTFDLALPPGQPTELTLSSPRTLPRTVRVPAGTAGGSHDLGELTADPGLLVRGRLLGRRTGLPVAGARIWTPRPNDAGPVVAWMLRDLLEASSDDEGRFELAGVPPRPLRLTVEAPALAPRHLPVEPLDAGSVIDLGDVLLEEGARLTVEHLGSEEPPTVARLDVGGRSLPHDALSAPFDEAGLARLEHVPAGRWMLVVERSGRTICRRQIEVTPLDDAVETLCQEQPLEVSGTVLVAGLPAGSGLLLWSPSDSPEQPEVAYNRRSGLLQSARVFRDGTATLAVPVDGEGRFSTDALHPGPWEVFWATGADSATAGRRIEIPGGEARAEIQIEFPGLAVHGVVLDADGQPVEDARVKDLSGGAHGRTRSDGTFVLAHLAPGPHRLIARHQDRVSATVAVELEIDSPPQLVELHLEEEASGTTLQVLAEDGAPAGGALVFVEGTGSPARPLTADRRGRLVLPAAVDPAAPLRAAAWYSGGWTLGDWQAPAAEDPMVLQLQGTGTLEIRSVADGATPEIRSENGWDVANLLRWLGRPPRLAAEEPLTIIGLPPMVYTIVLQTVGPLGERSLSAAVRAGSNTEVEIPVR